MLRRASGIPNSLCNPFGGRRRELTPRVCCLAEPSSEWRRDATISISVFPKICFAEAFCLNPVQDKRIHLRSENFLKVIRETRPARCIAMQHAYLRVEPHRNQGYAAFRLANRVD